ncbi:CinA family protein [Mycoplasma sp. HU2014]|uniref:CinA family protein n=1 Tax=Mycoplasma sp. HU2014 TaxID=1664275 RepID=UPI00067C2EBE|nr:CinA family protein [Mycoplasma sp. HU2014]KNG79543.1 putative competence-damage inducible protein [Mycoplasma sp. HU2014]
MRPITNKINAVGTLKDYLLETGMKISVCETFTGGMFSQLISDVDRPSEILIQSFIGFSKKFKIETMQVNKNLIRRFGQHSKECGKEIATNIKEWTKADVSVCFIGDPMIEIDRNDINRFYKKSTPHKTCYSVIIFPDNKWDFCEINLGQNYRTLKDIREYAIEITADRIYQYL